MHYAEIAGDSPGQPACDISGVKRRFKQSKFHPLGLSRPRMFASNLGTHLKRVIVARCTLITEVAALSTDAVARLMTISSNML